MRLHLPLFALALAACGDDSKPTTDTRDAADTSVEDSAQDVSDDTADTAGDTTADTANDTTADTSGDTADGADGADTGGDLGFEVRTPSEHTFTCEGEMGDQTMTVTDEDWICTFAHGGTTGHVYLQNTPTACVMIFAALPEYGESRGWIATGGQVSALEATAYDWGGNHHNDSLKFRWQGRDYMVYHSSFGFGWRQCQPMDCLQVFDLEGNLVEDGCTKDRTLPAVCRKVQLDGTWEPLVDTFAPCNGDPNYQQ